MSEAEEAEDALDVVVDPDKDWTTVEDRAQNSIVALAGFLRDHPLLPPSLEDPNKSWLDVESCVAFPISHCAFKGCSWTSEKLPCQHRAISQDAWAVHNGEWYKHMRRRKSFPHVYGCCNDETCLREHIVQRHLMDLDTACSLAVVEKHSYDYYLEAIAYKEQQKMPNVGPAIDRRTFRQIALQMPEESVEALVCMCCAQIRKTCNSTQADIGRIACKQFFDHVGGQTFLRNWDFKEYDEWYGSSAELKNHPELQSNCWVWRRHIRFGRFQDKIIICCPEDVTCPNQHERKFLCAQCSIAMCRKCLAQMQTKETVVVNIPDGLANDNFFGFALDLVYRYQARYIECAAASPLFTALITYYVEGDRGHMLNVKQHMPLQAYGARGNVYSFHMKWEDIAKQLGQLCEQEALEALPHNEHTLSHLVLFSLRVGDVNELNNWLPMARLRPHVVLQLLFGLVDAGFAHTTDSKTIQRLKAGLQKRLAERYPEKEGHLPESKREGYIPPAVEAAIRAAMRPAPGIRETGIHHKHATPAAAPEDLKVTLSELRPSSMFADRNSDDLVKKNLQDIVAMGKHYHLNAATGNKFVDQWNSKYVSLAFPFSIPRPVSGADYPRHPSERRKPAAIKRNEFEPFDPWAFQKALPARVEANVRGSWALVPGVRNLTVKWDALCGEDAACKHQVEKDKAGNVHAAELTEAAASLYRKLKDGQWWDGSKRRKINFDFSKLPLAVGLSQMEKNLVKDLTFLQKKFAGTQEVRLMIGHALFGARIEFGDPLFITISPSSRHSGLCAKLSRYMEADPAIRCNLDDRTSYAPWRDAKRPRIWKHDSKDAVIVELPEYTVRRAAMARDPWAVVQAFLHSVKFVIPRALGMQMCPLCPRCNAGPWPCSNIFGHNMQATGGFQGMGLAEGGSVEYQHSDNPHYHSNVHTASVYQHKPLTTIAEMMEKNLLSFEAIASYQSWIHREDHFDHEQHQANLDYFEKEWKDNNRSSDHDGLLQLPAFIREDAVRTMWSQEQPDITAAIADGAEYKKTYFQDAQYVMSRCHHHWHPKDPQTGKRHPLRGCMSKKCKTKCKGKFPFSKRLNLVPKVICPGNARKHDLRVSGRRNALGSILGRRRCQWLSGSMTGFFSLCRHNTHTGPNFRVPLLECTHDKECKADCLSKNKLMKLIACAQRAMRNTTGYFTGYIHKKQPLGKFELQQAAKNLKHLAHSIQHRSSAQQYHHMANRMLGDLEFRGTLRTATEEFNLAGNHHRHDVTEAEFIRTFMSKSFCGSHLLKRSRFEQETQMESRSVVSKVPAKHAFAKKKEGFSLAFEEAYGFRGNDPAFYYLSPWEFTKWWSVEYLKAPNQYVANNEHPKTQWCDGGYEYWENAKKDQTLPAPVPGKHYRVVETGQWSGFYATFPDDPETADLRHRAVLVRNERPFVPQPDGTPMPTRRFDPEERCRMLSSYLRPWVLHRRHASPHVPHMADLDIRTTELLQAQRLLLSRRVRRAGEKNDKQEAFKRSFELAWQEYRKGHVVSHNAARTIRNFLSTQLAESAEADVEEDEEAKRAPWEPVDTSWVSLSEIKDIIQKNVQLQFEDRAVSKTGKTEKWRQNICKTMDHIEKLWDLDDARADTSASVLNKAGSIRYEAAVAMSVAAAKSKGKSKEARASLVYKGLTHRGAQRWLDRLCTPGPNKLVPADEQVRVIRAIVDRCLEEAADEQRDAPFRSEPMQMLLHGVPGAGKSEVFKWIRSFFEEECAFTHGVEFVYLASQHTMTAIIGGFTIHSFGGVKFMKKDGAYANLKNEDRQNMSKLFLKYERLRWVFTDECSTASAEIQAEMECNIRKTAREENSWCLREDGSIRRWGGVNVCQAGDFWQFRPVKATAIFDNPFRCYDKSALEAVLQTFWTKGRDSINCFLELSQERRCKDPWLSYVLKGARHGTQEHEVYCFTHGLPTKHPGSYLPWNGELLCKNTQCVALTQKWTSDLLNARGTWDERRAEECDICTEHRARRCRVLGCSSYAPDVNSVTFVDAPFIHPFNAPKQHASQIRAVNYAYRTSRVLLWVVAEDRPLHKDHTCVTEEQLATRKRKWLTFHDQQTSGVVGLLPLVHNMPLRLTKTIPKHLDKRLFKNGRCMLHGWELHPVDEERLKNCTTTELVLQHMPLKLFIKMPHATWSVDDALGLGVVAIEPEVVTWALDKAFKVLVKRRGFCVASDFSGTAHSFVGATLKAVPNIYTKRLLFRLFGRNAQYK